MHLMETHAPLIATYQGKGDDMVDNVRYTEPGRGAAQRRVWINNAQYFEGVPPEVWEFHIGGYQVCEKWLKDRGPKKGQSGRKLSEEDILHYQRFVAAIKETIRLMEESRWFRDLSKAEIPKLTTTPPGTNVERISNR